MSRVAEIRARLAAATPGKWESEFSSIYADGQYVVVSAGYSDPGVRREGDTKFITSAPDDVAYLLARLDEAVALLRVYHQCRTCDGADVACGNCGGTGEDAAVAAFLAEVENG